MTGILENDDVIGHRDATVAQEEEKVFEEYLESTRPSLNWPRRTFCCESSRSFYCSECCQICIPSESYPTALQEGRLKFPFAMDIILDEKERRTSSTGIQIFSIGMALRKRQELLQISPTETPIQLFDLEFCEFPDYTKAGEEDTYVLFPDQDSVPISSVAPRKLVVLDMKWSRQNIKRHPNLKGLRKVHLEHPPTESRFWRWHNHGNGMLSTIEAIYFACREVTRNKDGWTEEDRHGLLTMLWLFALQRSIIHVKSELEQRILPFTKEGKETRRLQRIKQTGNPPKKKTSEEGSIYDTKSR